MLKIGLETESYHLLFQHKKMDIFSFIEKAHEYGLDGVQINVIKDYNLDENWGALGGNSIEHLQKVKDLTTKYGMYTEIDMRGLEYDRVEEVLKVASFIGADIIRTYIPIVLSEKQKSEIIGSQGGFDFAKIACDFDTSCYDEAIEKINKLVPLLKKYRIKLALENHEYETSTELVNVITAINSPWVGLHYDFGNSMMVWEEPTVAAKNMAPYTFTTHFKDHIIIEDKNEKYGYVVCGIPAGEGNIDLEECFNILMDNSSLTRINIEMCYPYCAQFKRSPGCGGVTEVGKGAFKVEKAPYNTEEIRPLQYYYPHEVSEKYLELMMKDQIAGIEKNINYLKKLRENYYR